MRKQIFHINRMRNLPLTRLELVQFTGHKQVGKQIATLRALGIQFNVSQEGKLNVCRADIEQFQEQPRPDFYRLRTHFSELVDHLSSDKGSKQERADAYGRRSA